MDEPIIEFGTETPEARQRKIPRWEESAQARIKVALQRMSSALVDMGARDANEGDTRLFVTDFLCDALGYDKYSDLTTEYVVRGQYADYGIRIDNNLVAFIEVKRVGTNLNKSHLRQVEMYAVNEGVEWVILTNGAIWQVYHIGNTTPIQVDLAMEVDLLAKSKRIQKIEELVYLSRESMIRRRMDELWQATKATAPESLGRMVLSDPVVSAIRQQLRRETGHRITNEEVTELLKTTVLRSEIL